MANSLKESGLTDSNMAQECGRELKAIAMSESGNLEKLTVTEFMFGSMAIDTKANLNNV